MFSLFERVRWGLIEMRYVSPGLIWLLHSLGLSGLICVCLSYVNLILSVKIAWGFGFWDFWEVSEICSSFGLLGEGYSC